MLGIGYYEDGTVGEIWVDSFKEGAEYRTALNVWARTVSKALQYGMPLEEASRTFRGVRGELSGEDGESVFDAVAKILEEECIYNHQTTGPSTIDPSG